MRKEIIVTHRGTNESIRNRKKDMTLKANYPTPNTKFMRKMEDSNKVVWVSRGYPNWWNRLNSGMVGKRGEASITFKIDKSRVRRPNGFKKIFGNSQLVIDGDIKIPDDAIFKFKK